MQAKLIVMRGVSGSGKSTEAAKLLEEFLNTNPNSNGIICSADNFFVNPDSGKYEFDASKLRQAHTRCKTRVELAMELGVGLILVDNTSTSKWEYQPYLDMAQRFDYEVEIVKVGLLDDDSLKVYANRNRHGVPLEVIQKQARRFK